MSILRSVLVADDEASLRHVLTLVLQAQGYEVRAVSNGEEALAELEARDYDAVISDVRMPRVDGLTVLRKALARQPDLTFVVMSAYGQPDAALEAVAAGAFDYVSKPFKPEEVVLVLKKAEERRRLVTENRRLRRSGADSGPLDRILGSSEVVKQLHKQILKVAPVSTTVLITGESGTGKELVARALHELSPRAAMPFVPVNCGAIPPGLVESELFGHARGAFTDARSAKRGLFAEADGGTLLLDEAGELPPAAQIKLLRFLQEGEIRAVGENRSERVDVRVLAATHRDLGKLVEKGEFREDLYYRLNVVNLTLPRSARAGRTCCSSRGPSCSASTGSSTDRRRSPASSPERRSCWPRTPGQGTSASWRTPSSGRSSSRRGTSSRCRTCPSGSGPLPGHRSGPPPRPRPRARKTSR